MSIHCIVSVNNPDLLEKVWTQVQIDKRKELIWFSRDLDFSTSQFSPVESQNNVTQKMGLWMAEEIRDFSLKVLHNQNLAGWAWLVDCSEAPNWIRQHEPTMCFEPWPSPWLILRGWVLTAVILALFITLHFSYLSVSDNTFLRGFSLYNIIKWQIECHNATIMVISTCDIHCHKQSNASNIFVTKYFHHKFRNGLSFPSSVVSTYPLTLLILSWVTENLCNLMTKHKNWSSSRWKIKICIKEAYGRVLRRN